MLTSNSNILKVNGSWLTPHIDYNPLNLPAKTIRVQFEEGVTPSPIYTIGGWDSCVQVSESPNIWDITKNSASWDSLLGEQMDLIGVLGANSEGVTSMDSMFGMYQASSPFANKFRYVNLFDTSAVTQIQRMFSFCGNIKEIPLFDFHSATEAYSTFAGCRSLNYLPNFDLSNVTNISNFCYTDYGLKAIPNLKVSNALTSVNSMFRNCNNVESGILDMYNKLSSLGSVTEHSYTFYWCGSSTASGLAELSQIPSDWGGTGA